MKLCLIGSTKFMELYVKANRDLTLRGHIVYTVATISTKSALADTESTPITTEQKDVLDLVHLRKIQESDACVLVTDDTGYFGYSTNRELIWAQMNKKPIYTIHNMDLAGEIVDPKELAL